MRTSCITIAPIHNRLMIDSCIWFSLSWAKRTMLERITHHVYRPRCTYNIINIIHSGFEYKLLPISFSIQIYKIERATAWDSLYLPVCCTLHTHTYCQCSHSTDADSAINRSAYVIRCCNLSLADARKPICSNCASFHLLFFIRNCDKTSVVIKVGQKREGAFVTKWKATSCANGASIYDSSYTVELLYIHI